MANSFDGEVVYVVADGAKAKFLHHKGGSFVKTDAFDAHGHHGAGSASGEGPRGTFGRVVADHMNTIALHGAFDGFVLAAPGEVLHEIKTHLRKPAEEKLLKTLVKDLVHIPEHDLLSHLGIPETGWKSV